MFYLHKILKTSINIARDQIRLLKAQSMSKYV